MATVRGFVRSYGAAVRRAEREQQRRAREAAKNYKEQLRQQEISNAADAVNNYNEYVRLIQSIHKECTESVDWDKIRNSPRPSRPHNDRVNETKAQTKLDSYKPSLLDRVFGLQNKKISNLEVKVSESRLMDNKEYNLLIGEYESELSDWEMLQGIAKGIEKGNIESFRDAIGYFNPFADMSELGTRIDLTISDNKDVDVDVYINGTEIIPDFELKQTAKGILSKKKMSKTKYNELYQDHVCSSIIRVSRELFAYLPIERARVSAIGKMLNSSTGHLEDRPVLSVIMNPTTINSLNMDTIDPSDSMRNFVHNMKFSKTQGFSPVQKAELK